MPERRIQNPQDSFLWAIDVNGNPVQVRTNLDGVLLTAPTSGTSIGDVNILSLPSIPAGNNNIGDVDVASLPSLPAGTNNIGDVDVLSLPSIPAGSNNIGDVDVLSLPSIPAGNNNIGDVDVASLPSLPAGSNNIGDVDVLTLPSIPAGTNNIGDVDVLTLPSIPAGSNNIGSVNVAIIEATTSGGLSIFRTLDLDETEEEVKATAGQVYSLIAINLTAAPIFLKFYNATAATVVVGTTTPALTIPIPGNADSDGAGLIFQEIRGIPFSTAICVAATTGVADNDTGAPAVNALIVQVFYK